MSRGELQIPLQLFTALVSSSTAGNMVEGGYFRTNSLHLVLSAADKGPRAGSSSLTRKSLVRSSMLSLRPS